MIKISILSKNDLKNAIEKSMSIVDTQCETVKFISIKFETKCNKCQKFEHITNTFNVLIKCQFCANMHSTHNHKCDTCKSNQICSHIDIKCANYDKKHHAKDTSCEVCFALKSNVRNIDLLHV